MENIRVLANKARVELGITPQEPIEIIENLLFKKANISIIKKKLQGKISGFCSRDKEGNSAILVNSKYSLGRQNFTVAHEYYHLKYDGNMDEYKGEKEKEANVFASYFLMPKEALELYLLEKGLLAKKDILTPKDIIGIAVYFKISYLAVLVRLEKTEKLLSKSKLEEYKKEDILRLAKINGISEELFRTTEEIFYAKTDYVEEVEKAFSSEKITYGKYEALLLEGGFEDIVFGLEEVYQEVPDGNIEDYI